MKDWNETGEQYGDVCYENAGYAKISATVADDSEALFTPCTYEIENVKSAGRTKLEPITEIVSFRGRFCQQAKTGEKVWCRAKLNTSQTNAAEPQHYRIIIGNKPADYMVLSKL